MQFSHRMIAYLVVAYVGWLLWRQSKRGGFAGGDGWLPRIGALVALQVALGIATLLTMVPISLALGPPGARFRAGGRGDGLSRGRDAAAELGRPDSATR